MALPKVNHTQISNDFIDNILKKISGNDVKVFLIISRKTIGWHKETDSISLSQIIKLTNMSKPTVIKSISSLENGKIITVKRQKTVSEKNITNIYEINYDSLVVKNTDKIVNNPNYHSKEFLPLDSKEPLHTKENKETITKEIKIEAKASEQAPLDNSNCEHNQSTVKQSDTVESNEQPADPPFALINDKESKPSEVKKKVKKKPVIPNNGLEKIRDFYFEKFYKKTGVKADYTFARDNSIFNRYLKKYDLETMEKIIVAYLDDDWGERCGYTVTSLQTVFQKLLIEVKKSKNGVGYGYK